MKGGACPSRIQDYLNSYDFFPSCLFSAEPVKSPFMPNSRKQIIEVAVPLHLDNTFHYLVPEHLLAPMEMGKRVLAPFGRRKLTGYVLGFAKAGEQELKEIQEVLDDSPLFTPSELDFFRWAASYYHHPLGLVIKAALPSGINIESRKKGAGPEEVLTGGRKVKTERFFLPAKENAPITPLRGKGRAIREFLLAKGETPAPLLRKEFGDCAPQLKRLVELGMASVEEREVYRDPFREEVYDRDTPLTLNQSQSRALGEISTALDKGAFAPFLLFGVTGSGKTEVYLQAIARALYLGKNALVLAPEIALTPQLVKRFRRRFSCGIAVLHSALSDGERFDEWRRIRRGEANIVIGARSAIFAPLERIGVIVVDEEHDGSYKQSEGFRYNARDLALVRGKMEGAVVVLGSATPLVTTFHAAKSGKLRKLSLPERVKGLPLPEAHILDMRGRKGESLSPPLLTALAGNLETGGQSLLFLNRRGFATFLACQECGHILRCPNCSVTLTFHQRKKRHICHYCDFSIPAPSVCPGCNGTDIGLLGLGTERVEEEIKGVFPEARVARMDRDTTTGRGGHARILNLLEKGEIDILIGTQMIAKGHDFPGVTLVGVVSADGALNLPDFRSAERTFQLITQVAGRAGRGDMPGKVFIQSLSPDHYALIRGAGHDFAGFYAEEIVFREEAGYPPFAHLACLLFSGNSAAAVENGALEGAKLLQSIKKSAKGRTEILGPATAPLAKIRGRFRWQILLKSLSRQELHRLLRRFKEEFSPPSTVRVQVDVDPVDML